MIEGPQNVETRDSDSTVTYKILELRDLALFDESKLEENFETREADDVSTKSALIHYEAMINHIDSVVGLGNTAMVFREHPDESEKDRCVKCRWNFLMVNNTSRSFEKLPDRLKKLKKVEEYFSGITDDRRRYQDKGMDFLPENGVLREAAIQNLASHMLDEAGFTDVVPKVDLIIEIERSESGTLGSDQYSVSETVHMTCMDQVPGFTIEELIYQASEPMSEKIDVDEFQIQLRKIVAVMHAAGIAHRDLSIRNIMLDSGTFEPRIIDFGKAECKLPLSHEDEQRDQQFVDEALRLLRKFKEKPSKALEAVKEMHAS